MITTGSVAGLAGALIWMRKAPGGRRRESGANAPHGGSFERYEVMERLLSSREMEFLASQPGLPESVKQERLGAWKRESLTIFRLYLGELTQDFKALHAQARRLVAESRMEVPDLASVLVRQQVAFFRARMGLEYRLVLFSMGIGSVDVAPLLQMVEAMRLDLNQLTMQASQSA
jgi:hypothetical protein